MPTPKIEARTAGAIEALKPADKPYVAIVSNSLMLRVATDGTKKFLVRYWVNGTPKQHTIRRPFGTGDGFITLKDAQFEAASIKKMSRAGTDLPAENKAAIARAKIEGLTFGDALREYVRDQRRADGRPLAERTQDDYKAMLDRELKPLADKGLNRLTADDLRRCYEAVKGARRQSYMGQVARAVLRWHGVRIEGDPFSVLTSGKQRIKICSTEGNPNPIPAHRLGAWWKAAVAINTATSWALRFQVLTGLRPGEVRALTVRDVDLDAGTVSLPAPIVKNRRPHTVLLSRSAWELAWNGVNVLRDGKKPKAADRLFPVSDARRTLHAIGKAAGMGAPVKSTPKKGGKRKAGPGTGAISPHDLRATFASLAESLVSAAVLDRMLNHSAKSVAHKHYVAITAGALRAGWQAVDDTIQGAANGAKIGDDPFDRKVVDVWAPVPA